MRRMTGTHVYGLFRCPRAVALDIHEDPSRRRPLREDEEFVEFIMPFFSSFRAATLWLATIASSYLGLRQRSLHSH